MSATFVHWLNIRDYLLFHTITCPTFPLTWCIVIFGGPYDVSACSGYRYFLTIANDCTRFTWIYMLKHKSDAAVAIPNFFNMVETHFPKKIKGFRSDNAKELDLTSFFGDKGVFLQHSC